MSRVKGSSYRGDAIGMRNALIEYVNSEEGIVSWQENYVSRTSH